MTIHAGVRLEHLPLCQHRVTGIVSRDGGLLARCGPKYCPMHNFRDVDWDAIRAVVEERSAQRAVA